MSATVEITEEDGEFTARDCETGTTGTGKTRATALAVLATRLGTAESDADRKAAFRTLAEQTRQRFEKEDVTEAAVEDAISWARSE